MPWFSDIFFYVVIVRFHLLIMKMLLTLCGYKVIVKSNINVEEISTIKCLKKRVCRWWKQIRLILGKWSWSFHGYEQASTHMCNAVSWNRVSPVTRQRITKDFHRCSRRKISGVRLEVWVREPTWTPGGNTFFTSRNLLLIDCGFFVLFC